MDTSNNKLKVLDSLLLTKDNHFEHVRLQDILFFKAETNYCTVYTKLGRFIYPEALTKLETQLPTTLFIRVHSNYVVHIKAISGFEGSFLYISENKIPVSKQYREDVFEAFKSI